MLVGFLTSLLLAAPVCHLRRDENGRIVRDKEQRALFQAITPCASTGKPSGACPGWVVDHMCPLKCCGKDDASNMQWQTKAEAKAKDAWEGDCSTCTGYERAVDAERAASRSAKPSATKPTSAPSPPNVRDDADPKGPSCCKHCTNGCPCGDSCISCDKECKKPPGCAC